MTKEQIEQKAKNVYMRCFDDDFEYTGVLHALEICVEETATETTKELQKQIEIDAKQIRALQKQNGELTDKLTKAKEIIKKLLTHYTLYNHLVSGKEKAEIAEAEQFLNSEVEK